MVPSTQGSLTDIFFDAWHQITIPLATRIFFLHYDHVTNDIRQVNELCLLSLVCDLAEKKSRCSVFSTTC